MKWVVNKSQSFLDFNKFLMYRLKKFFITTKQTLIKDVIKEWNMEWLTERTEIRLKLTYLCLHLTYLLDWFDNYASDGCLKRLNIARFFFCIFFPTLNWLYLTQNLHFHLLLYLLLLAWILFSFETCWHS